jgi:septum site-determining protein MinD
MAKRVVIFSPKGGVGKTVIAVNLAVALAKESKRVCLIELDLHAPGDMARMLDVSPHKSLVEMIVFFKENPKALKKDDFIIHAPSGADYLAGVLRPQQTPHLDSTKIKDILSLLDSEYDFIIIDAGSAFSDVFVTTINLVNLILLVVTPDILSIYQTKWTLDTLQFLHIPLNMVKMVLNRSESVSSITWQEIRFTLHTDFISQLPSEGRGMGLAVNRRVPIMVDSPRTKFCQEIGKLARQLATSEKLFIEHKEVESLNMKEVAVESAGDFWQKQGLSEAIDKSLTSKADDEIILLKQRIHSRLIEELDLKRMDPKVFNDPKKRKELKDRAEMLISNLLSSEAGSFIPSPEVRKKLVKEIVDEALGLGPLEDLLADTSVTDVMVNNKDEVYVERHGKIEVTNKRFISNEQVKTVIERIIAPIGRHVDESSPMVDARLPDGSRVNAIIPPLALTGPTLTIRKFRKERYTVEELEQMNSLSFNMAEFIKACVVCRKNMIVSGGTGSGKTTVLNVLSAFIPNNERIITIEDAAELKLHQEHWIRLESRPPNIEGKGAITIRDLFRNTLRMRPDRIIVGECRGIESLDMLQAMNTGHDGSMTTVHANSTADVLVRLDSMILMSGVELPIRAIREMVASAIDIVIHTARLSDGSRKIVQITELAGMRDEMHIELEDIFLFRQTGSDPQTGKAIGEFQATGYIPSFLDDIKIKGISLPDNIFKAPF